MVNNIISIFGRQAREHRTVKAFYYNRNYELGSGRDRYPLFWLEDPITGRNNDNVFVNSVNFAVLFVPDESKSVAQLQNMAFSIGLNCIERIKKDAASTIAIRPDWTYTTLRDYYDDNACGCRFSVNLAQVNMQNLCLIEEQFDTSKELETSAALCEFNINNGNEEVFANKFPEFNLKTRKR